MAMAPLSSFAFILVSVALAGPGLPETGQRRPATEANPPSLSIPISFVEAILGPPSSSFGFICGGAIHGASRYYFLDNFVLRISHTNGDCTSASIGPLHRGFFDP
jgi:hypothetical protein